MGYRKAETILPPEVVALIQQYVDGEYIYIPRREGKRKSWGETTGCRKETGERNSGSGWITGPEPERTSWRRNISSR